MELVRLAVGSQLPQVALSGPWLVLERIKSNSLSPT